MTLGRQCPHSREEGTASCSVVPDLGLSHNTGPVFGFGFALCFCCMVLLCSPDWPQTLNPPASAF